MALNAVILLALVSFSSAACSEDDKNCLADYDEEESGLAQIKKHEMRTFSEEERKEIEESFPGCKGVCQKPGSALCHPSNPFTKVDVGPSCGTLNSAKGCRKYGDITKAGTCGLCNGDWLKCCPKLLVPWCYVGKD